MSDPRIDQIIIRLRDEIDDRRSLIIGVSSGEVRITVNGADESKRYLERCHKTIECLEAAIKTLQRDSGEYYPSS